MNKIFTGLIVLLFSISAYSQHCDCLSNLNWLIENFEQNDAGFQYIIDKKGEDTYLKHNKYFRTNAIKISNISECHTLLNNWTHYFRKKHIYVLNLNRNSEATDENSIKPKELTKEQFKNYISYLKNNKKGFEGIWKLDEYNIGIIKKQGKYIGFIVNQKVNNWKQKQVKLEIYQEENNNYSSTYFMSDFTSVEYKNVELVGNNFLKIGNYFLERITPIGIDKNKVSRFVNLMKSDKPSISQVSQNTLLLRIPSFDYSQKKYIDSLLLKNHSKILKTENLIIDMRNNGGGALKSSKMIIPYLYTNPIKLYGYNYLSSPLNNKLWEGFIENAKNSVEFIEYAKNRLEKLNANMGGFVEQYSTGFSNVKDSTYYVLDTIYKNPKQIGVLINENNASSAEEFLFYAKQSKKVKLFGTKTGGLLDITDLHTIDFPSGLFRLYYCTAISLRLPEFPIDDYGIQPDYYYYDKTIKPYEWIDKTIEILNYK